MESIQSIIVSLCWTILTKPAHFNPRFKLVISSQEHLANLLRQAAFSFCPGLLDCLNNASPPLASWFESLPGDFPLHTWGVYLLVLRKPGDTPLIYVGSGTALKSGVRVRESQYRRGVLLPTYVSDALQDGYNISTIVLVAQCPIPTQNNYVHIRYVVILLEALFSAIFWAMRRRDRDYEFVHVCPWQIEELEWNGLVSHNPLYDLVVGDLNLTSEQHEIIVAANKEKSRQYTIEYRKTHPPTKLTLEQSRQHYARNKVQVQARLREAVLNKKYHCVVCNVSCAKAADLKVHNQTKRHLKKVALGSKDYRCETCDLSFKWIRDFNKHNETKRHLRKLEMGNDDYHCDKCNVSFRYLSDFNQHKATKRHALKTAC